MLKKIAVAFVLITIVSYFFYADHVADANRDAYNASLVSRSERILACQNPELWIPEIGDPVKISVDDSKGIVVFIAFASFESFDFAFSRSRKVDPTDCFVYGVDVRTNSSRSVETLLDGGTVERTTEPYAVVRFALEEISPMEHQ